MKYPVYIHSEEGIEGYGVVVPDLLGCVSHGDDVEDAFRMACEAVQLHVEEMVEDGDDLPASRDIEEIVEKYDRNGDGYIDFSEFSELIRRLSSEASQAAPEGSIDRMDTG